MTSRRRRPGLWLHWPWSGWLKPPIGPDWILIGLAVAIAGTLAYGYTLTTFNVL